MTRSIPTSIALITSLLFAVSGCKNSPDNNGNNTPPENQTNNEGTDAGPLDGLGDDYEPPFYDNDPTVEPSEDNPAFDDHPNLAQIRLPAGFQIRMYADVPNARSLAMADDGTLFVGNRNGDKVFAVRDTDGDMQANETITVASGLTMPNGVAMHEGDLYVAEVSQVWRFPDILESLPDIPEKELVSDAFPDDTHHGWKFIKFGPDGKLYVPVGAPCNICKTDYNEYSNIMRMDPDGSNLELYVKGVRNTVGFDWHPDSGELWFTDNGRDNMGDNRPPDELNHVTEQGQHFGYPFCHGGFVLDPEFGQDKNCADYRPPAQNLGPHVAALGMEFYQGEMFPEEYHKQIFIAEHGSWNRASKIGYRVMLVRLDENGQPTSLEVFAKGWLQGESSWGRPVDLEVMDDGSLLVSDDAAGAVYRIVYVGE